jgi:hypothetical protein
MHDAAQRVEILGPYERVRVCLRKDQARLGSDRSPQPFDVAVVHNHHGTADTGGKPLHVGASLVVDLSHEDRVRTGRHQGVEDERGGLHP